MEQRYNDSMYVHVKRTMFLSPDNNGFVDDYCLRQKERQQMFSVGSFQPVTFSTYCSVNQLGWVRTSTSGVPSMKIVVYVTLRVRVSHGLVHEDGAWDQQVDSSSACHGKEETERELLNLLVNLISIPHLAMSFWVVTEQNMKPGFTIALNSERVAHRVWMQPTGISSFLEWPWQTVPFPSLISGFTLKNRMRTCDFLRV